MTSVIGKDGDRRRDHAVAVEQGRAEQAERDEKDASFPVIRAAPLLEEQGKEGKDAAFPAVIRTQDEDDVLDADDEDQRPENQGEHADDVRRRRHDAVLLLEAFPQCVEGAGADVAVDHSERGNREHGEPSSAWRSGNGDFVHGRICRSFDRHRF
jgi:hypothetical protein